MVLTASVVGPVWDERVSLTPSQRLSQSEPSTMSAALAAIGAAATATPAAAPRSRVRKRFRAHAMAHVVFSFVSGGWKRSFECFGRRPGTPAVSPQHCPCRGSRGYALLAHVVVDGHEHLVGPARAVAVGPDHLVRHRLEPSVAGMLARLVGVVRACVVAADEGPPGVGRAVLPRCVEKVAVEEGRVPGLHLHRDAFVPRLRDLHPLGVRAELTADHLVLDPPDPVRTLEHLEAAVGGGGGVEGDEDAREQRIEAAVLVPVAVVLVPEPGTRRPPAP